MRTVNERQKHVLEWIGQGCPAGVMPDDTYKATAVALQSRRLITVTKRPGKWSAVLTEAGEHFVQHGEYPAGHWDDPTEPVNEYRRKHARPVTALAPVDQLVADLLANGGRLTIPYGQCDDVDNLVTSARRFLKLPPRTTVRWERNAYWEDRVLLLVPLPDWTSTEPRPVPLNVKKLHPAVAALKADPQRLNMARATRTRAIGLLNAIAVEATRRGYSIATDVTDRARHHGHLNVVIHGQAFTITVEELNDRAPHTPTAKELRDKELRDKELRYWKRIPDYDYTPSGRLQMEVTPGQAVQQDKFSDGKRSTLGDRLPRLLFELELRAANAEEEHLTQERTQAEHLKNWQEAYDQALIGARDDHRLEVLERQVKDWRWHTRTSEYLAALNTHITTLTGSERDAARAWADRAADLLGRHTPFHAGLAIPDDPKFTEQRLKPHMRGFPPRAPRPDDD